MLRFLVIENEEFVAAYIETLLNHEGLDVIGPVGTLDEAKLLARDEKFDGALIDVHTAVGGIDDVVAILTRRNIPYLFVTSSEADDLPLNHREATVVHKPFRDAELMRAVRQLSPQLRQ